MKKKTLALVFAWVLTPMLVAAEVTTAIKAGRLVDPEAGSAAANQVILIEDGKISKVGPGLSLPEGVEVIDLSDLTVMPGLFDCHAHMVAYLLKPQPAYYTGFVHSTPYRVLRGTVYAREMLEAGFTTIRNLAVGGDFGDIALAQAIADGFVLGPTMIPGGRFIGPVGRGAPANPERPGLNAPDHMDADTRDELKKAIRENIHYGARVIKIMADAEPYGYTVEDIRFIVEEAGRAGVRVAAHAVTDEGARKAAEAGVASIEHGTSMSPETLDLVKSQGIYVVPTPFTPFLIRTMGIRLSGMKDDDEWQDFEAVHKKYVAALKRNYQAGVKIAFGSDVGVIAEGETRGSLSISTIEGYLAAGVTPADLVRALTINAAQLSGVEEERGAIRPGLAADLIATPDNPLESPRTLERVAFVMKGGKVYLSPGARAASTSSGAP